jgi:hypothetical protein
MQKKKRRIECVSCIQQLVPLSIHMWRLQADPNPFKRERWKSKGISRLTETACSTLAAAVRFEILAKTSGT